MLAYKVFVDKCKARCTCVNHCRSLDRIVTITESSCCDPKPGIGMRVVSWSYMFAHDGRMPAGTMPKQHFTGRTSPDRHLAGGQRAGKHRSCTPPEAEGWRRKGFAMGI